MKRSTPESLFRNIRKLMKEEDDMLMKYINIEYAWFVRKLKESSTEINDSDIMICFFNMPGLSDAEITELLQSNKDSYRKRKFRLWKKVSATASGMGKSSIEEFVDHTEAGKITK